VTKKNVRAIAHTVADPTLPKVPVVVGGKTYNLCFDLGALAEAEFAINADFFKHGSDERLNLLAVLPAANLYSVRVMFAAALRVFHPEISFGDAQKLFAYADVYTVADAVRTAWEGSRGPEENPQEAVENEAQQ